MMASRGYDMTPTMYSPDGRIYQVEYAIETVKRGTLALGIRTKEACKIAGIDPARFNDMVHSGQFPCAPKTRPGSVRMFDLDQIVSMKIFGELLSLSVSPVKAGQ